MKAFLIFLASILMYGCAPSFKVNSYLKPDANLAEINTYYWSPLQEGVVPGHPRHDNPENRALIKQAIEKEMKRKGYTIDSLNPDAYVEYFISLENRRSVITAPLPYIDDFDYEYRVKVEQLKKGSLLIHLESHDQNETLWAGSAEATLEAVPTETKRKVNMAIKRIMGGLPAKEESPLIIKNIDYR